MSTIPTTIDGVNADWIAQATGWDVQQATHEQIGVGVGVSSAVYRTTLTGNDVPHTIVTKLPALAEEAVFTSTMLRMYIREVRFFENMAHRSPVRVPKGYYGIVDDESSHFVLLMEDMGAMRTIDQLEGMGAADAERAVDALAAWHAEFWGNSEALLEDGTAVSIGDPIYPAVLPLVFGEGWEKLTTEMALPEDVLAIGPHWVDVMPQMAQDLASGPNTALHGDYRGDNIMFDNDDNVVLLDFQITGHGSASYDLAYFMTQSLTAENAATQEKPLFDRWIAGLIAGGVPESETTDLWEMYRKAAYFCLVYPVVAARGMDLSDPRQLGLIEAMTNGFARAAKDLNLAEFNG